MPSEVRLEPPYLLNMSPTSPWLPSVERRIENSIIPKEYEYLGSSEWLQEDVGQSALRFFQSTADLLPGEPFIYASQSGALVAEFKSPVGTLTTIISPSTIIFFATKANQPDGPIERTLNRGTNRLREEVKEIVQKLLVSHGQMAPAL